MSAPLANAIALVPAGRWAVGVSGGADSVALLALVRQRADLTLHIAHLDHQARAGDSAHDAAFVASLAKQWHIDCTMARRDEIEPRVDSLPANISARFRALRLALFREVVQRHGLDGVILAHHRDDQAETILHRLLRGASAAGVGGMSERSRVSGLLILRPLLGVRRESLREYLRGQQLTWREDASNASEEYLRNRLRKVLSLRRELAERLIELGESARALRSWTERHAPALPPRFAAAALDHSPPFVARESARRWLIARGAPPGELAGNVLDRLLAMAQDASTPPRQHFPGRILVRRRGGVLFVE